MSKFNWALASLRLIDPARVQRSDDIFVTPDKTSNSKKKKQAKPPTAAQLQKQRVHQARLEIAAVERGKRKAEAKARNAAKQRLNDEAKAMRKAQAEVERKAGLLRKAEKAAAANARREALRVAFEEYQKTPEYAEEIARKQAAMNAKKKSHLQDWVEKQTKLNQDRRALSELWRKQLLSKEKKPKT